MRRALVVLIGMAGPALAEAPDSSLFPRARPVVDVPVAVGPVADAPVAEVPVEDAPATAAPDAAVDAAAQAALDAVANAATDAAVPVAPVAGNGLTTSPYPRARPAGLGDAASATTAPATAETAAPDTAATERRGLLAGLFGRPRPRPDRTDAAPRGNGICGNAALTGEAIPRIGSRTNGCGVEEPVQITAVDGITLSIPATMDCTTANALAAWVDQGLRPAFEGTQIVGLQVAGHYICRTRNHVRGARISEHGRGKAIDISGIILGDGRVLTVQNNWNRQMRAAYQAGCGIFGTTLGPGSDGYHEDHMHFDTANHRNGPYCR